MVGRQMSTIATIAWIVHIPAVVVLLLLWAPLVDPFRAELGYCLAAGTTLGLSVSFPLIGHNAFETAVIITPGVADSLVMASCGGLMVTPALGWRQAGQLCRVAGLRGPVVLWWSVSEP